MEALRFQEEFLSADRLLYRIAWSYLGNLQDVEDAVQTTLVKAWEKRKKLRSSEQFRPWIVRILINVCKDELHTRKKRSFFPLNGAAEQLVYEDHRTAALEIVQCLKPELRTVMALHYVDGYRIEEIASILGIPAGTVKSRIRSARQQLEKTLQTGE